jgi:hypothetical protein
MGLLLATPIMALTLVFKILLGKFILHASRNKPASLRRDSANRQMFAADLNGSSKFMN